MDKNAYDKMNKDPRYVPLSIGETVIIESCLRECEPFMRTPANETTLRHARARCAAIVDSWRGTGVLVQGLSGVEVGYYIGGPFVVLQLKPVRIPVAQQLLWGGVWVEKTDV